MWSHEWTGEWSTVLAVIAWLQMLNVLCTIFFFLSGHLRKRWIYVEKQIIRWRLQIRKEGWKNVIRLKWWKDRRQKMALMYMATVATSRNQSCHLGWPGKYINYTTKCYGNDCVIWSQGSFPGSDIKFSNNAGVSGSDIQGYRCYM